MELNKQLQNKIGSIIGKDYFKLEFGCKVLFGLKERIIVDLLGLSEQGEISFLLNRYGQQIFTEKEVEILGQEPTLNDVLLAIDKKYSTELTGSINSNLIITIYEDMYKENPIIYDLEKSIFNQSEEVKQQLLDLITK